MIDGASDTIQFAHRHLLGIEGLSPDDITLLLDRSESYVEQKRYVVRRQAFDAEQVAVRKLNGVRGAIDHKPAL